MSDISTNEWILFGFIGVILVVQILQWLGILPESKDPGGGQ